MDTKPSATGEAPKKNFENIYMREFVKTGRDSFQVRVTLFDGTPKIGFSRFWHNFQDGEWYPSKEHFFFKPEFWEKLVEKISVYAADIEQLGLSGMLLDYGYFTSFIIKLSFLYSFLFLNCYRFRKWSKAPTCGRGWARAGFDK